MIDDNSASDRDALDASEPILRGEIVEGPLTAAWSASPAPAHATSDQAVRLPKGLAEGVRDLVRSGWAAKKHLDAASVARDGLLVVLRPSPETKKGLADGTLKLARRRKDGSFLAQARSANTNAIVENLGFNKSGASQAATTAKAAAGGAAVAWQVMAIATQQHYLTEISGRLGHLEAAIDHLIERDLTDKESRLRAISEEVDLLEEHLTSGARLTAEDRRTAAEYFTQAREIWRSEIMLVESGAGSTDRAPADVIADLLLADLALNASARCAHMVLRLPFDDDQRRVDAFAHYAAIIEDAAERNDAAASGLRAKADAIREDWRLHEQARSNAKHNALQAAELGAVPVVGAARLGARRLHGKAATSTRPTFEPMELRRLRRPNRANVDDEHLEWIEKRAETDTIDHRPRPVLLHISPDWDISLLPLGTSSAGI